MNKQRQNNDLGGLKLSKFGGNEKQKTSKVLHFKLYQLNQTKSNMKFHVLINSEEQLIDGWKEVLRFWMIYSRWDLKGTVLMPHGRKENEFKMHRTVQIWINCLALLFVFDWWIRPVSRHYVTLRDPPHFLYLHGVPTNYSILIH